MQAVIFDGEAEAARREQLLRERVKTLTRVPRLATIVFDEDEPSQLYTKLKHEAAVRVGVEFERFDFLMNNDPEIVVRQIRELSERDEITGVMIQKPSKNSWLKATGDKPQTFDEWWHKLTVAIEPSKDADCLTQVNLQNVYEGVWTIVPATVKAILSILHIALEEQQATSDMPREVFLRDFNSKIDLRGFRAVVVGRSEIVGRPLAAILLQWGARVDLCGSKAESLADMVTQADIVVSATGVRNLVKGSWIKEGTMVIDVGSPGAEVEFEEAAKRAAFITPVPYGVGPVTVVSLLENLVEVS